QAAGRSGPRHRCDDRRRQRRVPQWRTDRRAAGNAAAGVLNPSPFSEATTPRASVTQPISSRYGWAEIFFTPARVTTYVVMVIPRRSFIVSLAALLGPRAADAQRSGKAPRVGILCPHRLTGSRGMPRDVFEHALGDRGWTPGSTVVLEYRDTNK